MTNTSIFLNVLVLVVIIILGSFFRFYEIDEQPYWIDEAISVLNVLSIQEIGNSIMASGDYYSCPLYCFPTAFLGEQFGNTSFVFRVIPAIFGTLFIFIIFLVTRKLFNTRTALLSSFITAFSYYQITWSRQARWYTLMECFFWLAILFFVQAREAKEKKLPIVLTVIFTVLAMVAHPLSYLLPLIFGSVIIYDYWKAGKLNFKLASIVAVLVAGIFILCETVLGLSLFAMLSRHIELKNVFPYYFLFYVQNYWFLIILSLLAVYKFRKDWQVQFLVYTFLSYFMFLSFLGKNINYSHLFQVTPVLIILGSVGILSVLEKFHSNKTKVLIGIALAAIFLTVGSGILIPSKHYRVENDNPKAPLKMSTQYISPQPNWNGAYEYIQSEMGENDKIISTVPQFNKIFLDQPGYWLSYISTKSGFERGGKDIYVGAEVVHNVEELKEVTSTGNGFIIFEGVYDRVYIDDATLSYITTMTQVYHEVTDVSAVVVYRY